MIITQYFCVKFLSASSHHYTWVSSSCCSSCSLWDLYYLKHTGKIQYLQYLQARVILHIIKTEPQGREDASTQGYQPSSKEKHYYFLRVYLQPKTGTNSIYKPIEMYQWQYFVISFRIAEAQ